ncbi:DUF6508 domain-containing protein [Streptomyces sp. Ncost-T10-10d]|uniref:DUF6508 domain-containing protein n=1 Tax=Streptomyces sp. Ncost-T10-10d TaxID=1839774 RepID=UPI00081DD050|nr:DUF6508 domain-containing protein [Streptomyces sp. Ncost-T10-10d]SCF78776.1 hypothetical protein GA0115254_11713 [Streptomyces sp. Ncost-T10-10d]
MTYEPAAPRYRAETDRPVHHLTVANARGEAMGYLWANDEDDAAGWCLRPAGDRAGFDEGLKWSTKLKRAKARGLVPTAALAELVSSSDPRRVSHIAPNSLTTAPSLAALKELARVVTEADDRRLLAQLDRGNADAWRELREALAALTDEDRDVRWSEGGQQPDGTWRMRHPVHSERLRRLVGALPAVGAVTSAYLWQDNPPPAVPDGGRLSPADAVRAATAVVRGERFCDGTIAQAVETGLLDAVAESLCAWYEAVADGPRDDP